MKADLPSGPLTPQQVSFWTSYGIINMLTEVIVISLPVVIIWKVHMLAKQKLVVIACFAVRLSYETPS